MQALRDAQDKNGKIKEKVENGELSDKDLLLSSLPKQKEKEIVYIPEPYPVVKEVRILKDNQGTELSVTDIIKHELDLVRVWEYMNVPISEMSVGKLRDLGNLGWKFAFDIGPITSNSYKTTTFVFQRPKMIK